MPIVEEVVYGLFTEVEYPTGRAILEYNEEDEEEEQYEDNDDDDENEHRPLQRTSLLKLAKDASSSFWTCSI